LLPYGWCRRPDRRPAIFKRCQTRLQSIKFSCQLLGRQYSEAVGLKQAVFLFPNPVESLRELVGIALLRRCCVGRLKFNRFDTLSDEVGTKDRPLYGIPYGAIEASFAHGR
jgi:hypothetical protein